MAVNYSNMPNPSDAIMRGMQIGGAIEDREAKRTDRANALARQEQMNADISAALARGDPSAADYAALTMKYPEHDKQFKQAWGMVGEERKQNHISNVSEVYAALESGQPDIALGLLDTQAKAAENSGDASTAKGANVVAELIKSNPKGGKAAVALKLASMMGPDKFTETFTKLQADRRATDLEGANLTEKQAKAAKAAVEADFAESEAVADLQKKGWDIYKIQEDTKVAKQNSKIAAMNAEVKREQLKVDAALKRDKMSLADEKKRADLALKQAKLEEMKRKRDAEVVEKAAEAEAARYNIDNMINTLDRVAQTPLDVMDNAMGPVSTRVPTFRQSTANFQELITTVDSQAFLSQIPQMKGLGALSDAEGERVVRALQSFSLRQSPERLMENVEEAQRLLLKARKSLASRYGVPDTIPDSPAVKVAPEEVETLLQRYGGYQ